MMANKELSRRDALKIFSLLAASIFLPSGCTTEKENPWITLKGGIATVGRTPEEAREAHSECRKIMEQTQQDADAVCGPEGDPSYFSDNPQRDVEVAAFKIHKYEEADENGMPRKGTYADAQKNCEEQGGRLPTREEAERAARGLKEETRQYPWGNTPPDATKANIDLEGGHLDGTETDVHAQEEGDTPEGIRNLMGNTAERLSDGTLFGGNKNSIEIFSVPSHILDPQPLSGWRCVKDVPQP